jgi:hypothetical protein
MVEYKSINRTGGCLSGAYDSRLVCLLERFERNPPARKELRRRFLQFKKYVWLQTMKQAKIVSPMVLMCPSAQLIQRM